MDKEKLIFRDCYNFLTKYINIRGTDAEWAEVVQETIRINRIHSSKLCTKMLVAAVDHLEDEVKRSKELEHMYNS